LSEISGNLVKAFALARWRKQAFTPLHQKLLIPRIPLHLSFSSFNTVVSPDIYLVICDKPEKLP